MTLGATSRFLLFSLFLLAILSIPSLILAFPFPFYPFLRSFPVPLLFPSPFLTPKYS